jgi:hypothetical protein
VIRCARIAELLTAFACWENGLSVECQDASTGLISDLGPEETQASSGSGSGSGSGGAGAGPLDSSKVRPVLSADEKQRILAALPKEVSTRFLSNTTTTTTTTSTTTTLSSF